MFLFVDFNALDPDHTASQSESSIVWMKPSQITILLTHAFYMAQWSSLKGRGQKMYVIVITHKISRHISSYWKDQNQATHCTFSGKENWIVERKRMEESSIVETEEGQWLDFLPAKTSEEPGRVGAEVGFHHFWSTINMLFTWIFEVNHL